MNLIETIHWFAVGYVLYDVVSGVREAFSDDTHWWPADDDRGESEL